MSGYIIVIPADEAQPVTTHEADKQPTLHELHDIVAGYIEAVPYWEVHAGQPCVAYCNEEGKLNGLPTNMRATVAWYQAIGGRTDDVLVGNVVLLVNLPDDDEEETDR